MIRWHFLEGLRGEWRWYRTDEEGRVTDQSPGCFAEMPACMNDAARAGFAGYAYRVHTKSRLTEFPRDKDRRSQRERPDAPGRRRPS
jgi:hypothetical protein